MVLVHSNLTGNRFFYCIECKTRRLVCCQICYIYIHPSSFTIINVTLRITSALTVYIYSFKVTSNKNIHTCSTMCIVGVHSDVHLSSSVPSFSYFSFLLPNIKKFNNRVADAMTYALYMRVSFDIQHILELCMRDLRTLIAVPIFA